MRNPLHHSSNIDLRVLERFEYVPDTADRHVVCPKQFHHLLDSGVRERVREDVSSCVRFSTRRSLVSKRGSLTKSGCESASQNRYQMGSLAQAATT